MDTIERLEKLRRLREEGVLTNDEFEAQKQWILRTPATHSTTVKTKAGAPTFFSLEMRLRPILVVTLPLALAFLFLSRIPEKSWAHIAQQQSYFDIVEAVVEDALPIERPMTFDATLLYDDIYPVHLRYLAQSRSPLVSCVIHNPNSDYQRLTVEMSFSDIGGIEEQVITVPANTVFNFPLSAFPHSMMEISTQTISTFHLTLRNQKGTSLYSNSWSVQIHAGDEMPWSLNGEDLSPLIASWVTPNNSEVEKVVAAAKNRISGGIPLARNMTTDQFATVIRTVFNSVRDLGVSYVSSTVSFGEGNAQRVRFPEKSLRYQSANCIDGSVLLASIFENIGLNTSIVITPEHAFVGVAPPNDQYNVVYIETTLLGRPRWNSILKLQTAFSAAEEQGAANFRDALARFGKDSPNFRVIDIAVARDNGILPLN